MGSCPICNLGISEDWDYCNYCGAELIQMQENSRTFAYDQLFELMKLEGDRTALLDSKASTYSGLLGVAVTILMALGGVVASRGFEINEIRNHLSIQIIILIIYSLYALTVFSFIVGAIYAFRAYVLGSYDQPNEEMNSPIPQARMRGSFVSCLANLMQSGNETQCCDKEISVQDNYLNQSVRTNQPPGGISPLLHPLGIVRNGKECYYTMDFNYLANCCSQKLGYTKEALIPHLRGIILNNYNVNNQKSKEIYKAHDATLFGIFLFILLITFIGLNRIGLL